MNLTISFVLLLFISTAYAEIDKVKLKLAVLLTDLNSISLYYDMTDDKNIPAFIQWPHNIDFNIGRVEINNENYLKVDGKFTTKKMKYLTNSYNGLYFKKPARLYVMKQGKLRSISHNSVVHYKQTTSKKEENPYLSIRYRSIDEVETALAQFYTEHKSYMDSYSMNSPSTFLATWDVPTEHFVEYTTWRDQKQVDQSDGGLGMLIGTLKNNKVAVTDRGPITSKLVLDPTERSITVLGKPSVPIPEPNSDLQTIENVFGVRMAAVGYLAVVQGDSIKMLGCDAWDTDTLPLGQRIKAAMFLEKTRKVEPKICLDEGYESCMTLRPKMSKFQVYGHVLIKRINYLEDDQTVKSDCPIVIEFERTGENFMVGSHLTKQICTDNEELWDGTRGTKYSSFEPWEYINLLYKM